MEEIYNEIENAVKKDIEKREATMSQFVCKLTEEVGELAREVNKLTGRKKIQDDESYASIRDNILEEGMDTIQCVIAVLIKAGITYEELIDRFREKNGVYGEYVDRFVSKSFSEK